MSFKLNKAFAFVFCIVAVDQITKYLALEFLSPDKTLKLLPFLNLVYVENKGTAFGFFKFLGPWFFIAVIVLALSFLIYMYIKDKANQWIYLLIIAGAIGNLIDRVFYGFVIDFIDFHIGSAHWPAFNVADSAISIGIVFFIYKTVKKS